jgi:hypothetical protein
MLAHAKNAAITTGIVLVTIFVLNQIPFTRPLVQKAINGQ